MVFSTDALVLRSTESGEFDRILTLLTPENGKITVIAKGVRSPRSKLAALSQPFAYGNFEVYRKGDMNWLRTGAVAEYFGGVRNSIDKLSLAAYVCDVATEITGEGVPAVDILRMTLNTLYALGRGLCPDRQIKAVYELRAAGYAGYMPEVTHCEKCGFKTPEISYLDVMNGRLLCAGCLKTTSVKNAAVTYEDLEYERSILMPLTSSSLAAVRFALHSLPERIFSFRVADKETLDEFARAAETYLLNHLERGFDSLVFYRTVAEQ